jgi:hypothetical protein
MTKLIFAFRSSANATEDSTFYLRIFKEDERGGAREMYTNFGTETRFKDSFEDLDSDGG